MTGIAAALDILGLDAHLEVIDERQELVRFAESRVTYQHSEQRLLVRARVTRDNRVAWATTSRFDANAIRELRDQLDRVLDGMPNQQATEVWETAVDGRVMDRRVRTYFDSTAQARAEDRVQILRTALAALPADVALGGSISHSTSEHTVADTRGLRRNEGRTRASVQFVASRAGGVSSFGGAVHRDADALPLGTLLDSVTWGLQDLPPRSLAPGAYRAVLAPQATLTLLAVFAQIALAGRQYLDGTSALSGRTGDCVTSPRITLFDDGFDPDGLPSTFDCEGTIKQRVLLLDKGVLRGVVHDTTTAHRAGVCATGHTAPLGWRFGADPIPSHVLLATGDLDDADIIAACDNGLFIQRVDYVRVVNAKQTLVTGTTRDATLWIENGRVAARLPQFRFTVRLADLLESTEAVGSRRERGDTVFMESVVAPALLVSAFPVQLVVTQ